MCEILKQAIMAVLYAVTLCYNAVSSHFLMQ